MALDIIKRDQLEMGGSLGNRNMSPTAVMMMIYYYHYHYCCCCWKNTVFQTAAVDM